MTKKMNLIPQPEKFKTLKGFFELGQHLAIYFENCSTPLFSEVKYFKEKLMSFAKTSSTIRGVVDSPNTGLVVKIKKSKFDYRLMISKDKILLEGSGKEGVFHGLQTLLQLVVLSEKKIPCCLIEDKSYFELRGFYHDVTRSKVPTLATLKKLVECLAFYKINHLQLYIEHTFAFKDIPELWVDKDPLTAEEILELDEFAARHHVELVPSLSTFGHMYEMLRVKKLEHLNELDVKGSELKHCLRDRMRHYTLDVNQKGSITLVKSLIDEYLPLFRSSLFNICCDETFDLGKGKNLKQAEKVGSTSLYVGFLNKVISHVISRGKKVLFWGDIIIKDPSLISKLPKDLIYLNWNYSAQASENDSKVFASKKLTQVMCPGVIGWNRFSNHIVYSNINISKMTSYAKKYKALGVLNTDWGDMGHVNMLANSKYGLAFGAYCSWTGTAPDENIFENSFSRLEWGDSSGKTATLQKKLCDNEIFNLRECYGWVNKIDGHEESFQKIIKMGVPKIEKKIGELEKIKIKLIESKNHSRLNDIDYDEFLWSSQVLLWLCETMILRIQVEKFGKKNMVKLKNIITLGYSVVDEFQRLWRLRNKESEMRHVRDLLLGICRILENYAYGK